MINNRDGGFTLMELVTVISILGILAAMAVPKFFNLRFKAEIEVENQIIGTIRAGLETFAAQKIAFTGKKLYPAANSGAVLSDVLSNVPATWSFTSHASLPAGPGTITHTRSDSTITWTYTRSANDVYAIAILLRTAN